METIMFRFHVTFRGSSPQFWMIKIPYSKTYFLVKACVFNGLWTSRDYIYTSYVYVTLTSLRMHLENLVNEPASLVQNWKTPKFKPNRLEGSNDRMESKGI